MPRNAKSRAAEQRELDTVVEVAEATRAFAEESRRKLMHIARTMDFVAAAERIYNITPTLGDAVDLLLTCRLRGENGIFCCGAKARINQLAVKP